MKKSKHYWAIFAGPTVTVALGFGITLDNVNVIKLLALGIFGGFALAQFLKVGGATPEVLLSPRFAVAVIFLIGLAVPLVFSDSPVAQQIYGVSGRQLGFLHYLFLLFILLGISTLNAKVLWPKIVNSLIVVGVFEATYGLMQYFGLDLFSWRNSNNWIFGTFGNPNYLSSFLALSAIATVYKGLVESRKLYKFSWFLAALFQGGLILLSASTQGLILLVFGFLAFVLILAFQNSNFLGWTSFSFGCTLGIVGLLGIFRIGPLKEYLYQDSVSYRGDYWRAGFNMFMKNWIHGVGLDSYGDYYRMFRDSTAANRRGLDLVSNSAHNIFVDLAATGGVILLFGYISILGLTLLAIIKRLRSSTLVTLEYKLLVTLWAAFNLQSLISINVPALAVWGWTFSGLLLAYKDEGKIIESAGQGQIKKNSKTHPLLPASCISICVILVAPLVGRDANLATAFANNKISEISHSILVYPIDADQVAGVAIAYEKMGRHKEAFELARRAVSENPNSPRAWRVILQSQEASQMDKKRARLTLRRLDPFSVD
jgi:O-antigen ligase